MSNKRDLFWEYIKKDNPENFWNFLRKVNERLSILFQNKVPNHYDLDETEEELIRCLYELYVNTNLYQPADYLSDDEVSKFTDKLSVK